MFSFLRNGILPSRRRDSLFCKYAPSLIKFISTDSTTPNSFAISYLINSCGVSHQKAITYSKKIHFESSENPDQVLALFRDNGFSNTHISRIIGGYPFLLLYSVEKTLKPKFHFFKSRGITGSDFAQVLCGRPNILAASLEKKIIPCFELMRSMVHTDADKLLAILKRSPNVLQEDPQQNLIPNVAILQANGVPADNITKLLVQQPRSLLKPTSSFLKIVEDVKQMKFLPSQYMFLLAVQALTQMSISTFEAKLDVYRGWGLSEDEVQSIFRKSPHSMMISEKNIMSTMNYFVNEVGYTPSLIAKHPDVLKLSLTRSIIPRCSVIQLLKTKDLIGKCSLSTFLKLPEENFLTNFVIRFEKEVPELSSAYKLSRKELHK